MTIEELVELLDNCDVSDETPWIIQFNNRYCNNCELVVCHYEDSNRQIKCAWCELEGKCRFFSDKEETPDYQEKIEMWLKSEIEEE